MSTTLLSGFQAFWVLTVGIKVQRLIRLLSEWVHFMESAHMGNLTI